MRERAGLVDLSAFAIFDIVGSGSLAAVQGTVVGQMDVPPGRVVYTPVLDERGGIRSDLTIMRLSDDHFRVVTGGATGNIDRLWFADHLPADGTAAVVDQTSAYTTIGLWGPRARDILGTLTESDISHEAFRFGTCRDHRARRDVGSRLADLVRRRAGLGALRADGARRPGVGPGERGRRTAWSGAGRDRRVRHHRADREGLSGPWRGARHGADAGRGGDDATQGQGSRLRRSRGLSEAARRRAAVRAVLADGRRPHLGLGGAALHARRRTGAHAATASRSSTVTGTAPTSPRPGPRRPWASTC